MRDQFAVELGKSPLPHSGDGVDDTPTSKWPYFIQLLFLRDVVKPRSSTGNLSNLSQGEEETETTLDETQLAFDTAGDELEEVIDTDFTQETLLRATATSPSSRASTPTTASTARSQKRRAPVDTFNASLLDIEKKKLKYLEAKEKRSHVEEDENLLFFKSLLPHVRKIEPSRMLSFRGRVQELVEQFAYPSQVVSSRPTDAPASYFELQNNNYYTSL